MIIFYEPHKEFLKKLISNDVEFILIGGYAVNYHGYNRPTGDLDIWLKPDNANRDKLLRLLRSENFSEEGINKIARLDFSKPVTFYFGKIPLRIDFLTHISGVKFNEAWQQKVLLPMEDCEIPILQLHHLVLSKISNDRTQDKLDVEELQKIIRLKKKKEQ